MIRLLEKFELWLRHRAESAPYTAYCYWCNVPITAATNEILEVVQSHNRHPAHLAAKARKENHG